MKKTCLYCGNEFVRDVRNTYAYFRKAKYCSQACAGAANSERLAGSRPPMSVAFAKKYVRIDGCWEWRGCRDKDGYGLFTYAGKQYRAPSIALKLDGRPVPRGMYACHHCDNPACVRPSHLYVGTPADNSRDASARGRTNPGARAKLTVADVLAIRQATGTHEQIASRFGISRSNASLIKERKTWRRVP